MKKKLLPIALLSAMLLVGCGGGSKGSESASSAQTSSQEQQSSEQSTAQESSEQTSSQEEQSSEQISSQEEQSSEEESSEEISSEEESSEELPSSEEESSEELPSSEEEEYGVEITNKQDILAETIHVGDHIDLNIELTPEANVQLEIRKGNLTITSSDPEVVAVTGVGLNALKDGTVTITVAYHGVTDELDLTVEAKITPKVKYGTVHEGTLEDPFDNADAWKVGLWAKDNGTTPETDLYIKGKVQRFYNAPGSRTDGQVAFYLEKAEGDAGQFEVYKIWKDESGTIPLTDDDIWLNTETNPCEVTCHGPITYYASSNQPETSYATLDKVEGTKPLPPETHDATVGEVITLGKAYEDGAQSYDFYNITGYVVRKSGSNYFMADTQTVDASVADKDLFELYNISDATEQAKLLEGAKVTVKTKVKNYHGQIENGSTPEITVVEEGTPWSAPEPAVAKKSLAEFIALAATDNGKHAYEVTAEVKGFKNGGTENDEYGNLVLTDGTNDLVIYGCSATATALAWDGSAAYAFKNPKDFQTNEVTSAIKIGDTLKMKLIRADYKETIQGTGIVLEVNPDEGGGGQGEVDYGTLEKPLSVATLLADNGTICPQTQGSFSAQKVVVKGVLKEATYSDSYKTYSGVLQDVTDSTKTIKFTGVKLDSAVAEQVAQNDTVILEHYLEYYNDAYALYYKKDGTNYDYGDFLKLDAIGTSTVTVDVEHATVTGLEETYTNYQTASFTVTVEEGYDLTAVKAYGKVLEATEGVYSFTVAGDAKVEVLTQESGAVVTSIEWTATSETTTTIPAAYSADLQEEAFDLGFGSENVKMNGANIKSGGTYIMLGSKAQGAVAFVFNTAAVSASIKSIVITTGAGASDSATYAVTFGTAALSTATTEAGVNVKKGSSQEFACNVENATYFQIASTSTKYNGQIAKIVINFDVE